MVQIWQLVAATLVVSSLASPLEKRFPQTGECTGVCQGRLHDPAVVYRADINTYYRFTTNDGITTSTAPNISGPWTYRGAAFPEGSVIDLPGRMDLWAPDVFEDDGIFYMYYSVSAMGSQNSDIGVASSSTMDPGSWNDHGSLGIPQNSSYNRIDPNLFRHSAESEFLLTFGSFWGQLFQVPLTNPPYHINGDIVHLAKNDSVRPAGLVSGSTEGSYIFQWNGFFYLFFSSGNCCNELEEGLAPLGEEYRVMVCRSLQPNGGFVDRLGRDCLTQNGGSLILASHDDVYAPGGQGVFWDPQQNSVVMYYHYVKNSVSYSYDEFFFGWNKLDFVGGWPVVV